MFLRKEETFLRKLHTERHNIEGYRAELYYLRDVEKREVDFLITINKKLWFCVEAKLSKEDFTKNIEYFSKKLEIPFCY